MSMFVLLEVSLFLVLNQLVILGHFYVLGVHSFGSDIEVWRNQ